MDPVLQALTLPHAGVALPSVATTRALYWLVTVFALMPVHNALAVPFCVAVPVTVLASNWVLPTVIPVAVLVALGLLLI